MAHQGLGPEAWYSGMLSPIHELSALSRFSDFLIAGNDGLTGAIPFFAAVPVDAGLLSEQVHLQPSGLSH